MIARLRASLRNSAYLRDIAWQASGNSLAQIIGVLGIPLLTRLYSPHDFALQNLFLQAAAFMAGVMTWRYEYFIQLPKEETDSKRLLQLVLLLGLCTLIFFTPIFWIFRQTFAQLIGDRGLVPWMAMVPASALLMSCALAFQHRMQRQRKYHHSGLSELAGKGAYIGAGVIGSWIAAGPLGLIIAPACSAIGKISYLSISDKSYHFPFSCPKKHPPHQSWSVSGIWCMTRAYFRLSNSMVFSHVMMTFTTAIPAIYIAHAYGVEVLGQFSLVISTIYLPAGLIGTAIGQVFYQRAAEHWAHQETFSVLWSATAKRLLSIGAPVYIAIGLAAPFAYPLVFGSAWSDAGHYARWMAAAAFFSFISSPLDRTSLVIGVWWYLPVWHFLRAMTTAGITILAWINNWNFEIFLELLVVQMCSIYMIDFFSGRRFSLRRN